MKINLTDLVDNAPYFSNQLDDLYYTPNVSGDGFLSVFWYYTYDSNSVPLFMPFQAHAGEPITFAGLGKVFRELLINADNSTCPTGTFWIFIYVNNNSIFNKPVRVIPHYNKAYLKAGDYIYSHFLNDCKISVIPFKDGDSRVSPFIYFYKDQNPGNLMVRLYNTRTESSINWNPEIVENKVGTPFITTYKISYKSSMYFPYYKIVFRESGVDNADFEALQLWRVPAKEGRAFVFRNSFGLAEYVFIPGVISDKSEKSYSEIRIGGSLRQIDVENQSKFTLKVDAAPKWLVDNARALLNSDCVFMLDDPCDFNQESMRINDCNVTVEDLSGNISEDPGQLSDFTLTIKRTDL